MSRFSGLPEPRSRISAIRDVTATGNGAAGARRFDDLLARGASLGSSTRLAAHRAEKVGEPVIARTSSAKAETSAVKPAANPVVAAKSGPTVAAALVKREPWKVPADVEAKGATAAAGYRVVFEAVSDQLGRMAKLPAAEGRVGSVIHMVAGRLSDAEIKSKVERQLSDRDRASDAMWERARARSGSPSPAPKASAAPAERPLDGARARMLAIASSEHFVGRETTAIAMLTNPVLYGVSAECIVDLMTEYPANARSAQSTTTSRSDAVWDRARASIDGGSTASTTASKPAAEAKSRSADDVWTRAYAAVAR